MVTVLFASRTVPPLAMSAYDLTLAFPAAARTASNAAVRVVLPWSMCPMVPTLTCGFVRVKVSLAIVAPVVSWILMRAWVGVPLGRPRPRRYGGPPSRAGPTDLLLGETDPK